MSSFFDTRGLPLSQMRTSKEIFVTFFISLLLSFESTKAQDSLPNFTLTERSGMVIIGWLNPYPELSQLIIQRSSDSLTGFRSIVSMPDPTSISNGFVDRKPGAPINYYRIYYVNPGGRYFFTASKKVISFNPNGLSQGMPLDKASTQGMNSVTKDIISTLNPDKALKIKRETGNGMGLVGRLDSTISENAFTPSAFIFTNLDGNLIIALPDALRKKFSLHVYKEDGTPLFNMKNIKEVQLLIDRSNFFHSGWFKYDLYEGERLREQNRFFIPPEGR